MKPAAAIAKPKNGIAPKPVEQDKDALESAEEARDMEMIAQRTAADKISRFLDKKCWVYDQVPTQVVPDLIAKVGGDITKIPKYRFGRRSTAGLLVIDTFRDQRSYDAADVEGRRAWCKSYGVKYAALGPKHSLNDLIPQLGL
jgi:hypothetical protein